MSFPIPDDEPRRLARLAEYDLLDSVPEPAFDRVAAVAARIFDVPTALISLVDADRQWFKARIGCPLDETPRDIAFCAHAVAARETLVVPDATADPRFAANPLVTDEPGIRFYAGAPLMTDDGHALGTLCLIDTRPRAFDDRSRQILEGLAETVMELVGLRRALAREMALTTRLSLELSDSKIPEPQV